MTGTIYALLDPETEHVRYVGLTTMPLIHRLHGHQYAARSGSTMPVHAWMRTLCTAPVIVALEENISSDDLLLRERYWILTERPNLNVGFGGRGGDRLTPEGRERISTTWRGRKHTDETRERMRQAHAGRVGRSHTVESRKKISESHKTRKPISDETRARMRAAQRARRERERLNG